MTNKTTALLVAVIALVVIGLGVMIAKKDKSVETTQAEKVENVAPAADGAAKGEEAAKTDAAPTADDPVVAKVNGDDIKRSEVLAYAKNLPPQMQQIPPESLYPLLVEQVIAAKIIDQKAAKETDLTDTPEYQARVKDAQVQIKRAVFLEKELDKDMTGDRLEKAYDKFKTTQGKVEEVHARHILVATEAEAKDIIVKLDGGAKFEDLAKEHSTDASNKASGGDLGYFTKDSMVKEFADAAFALDKGAYTKTPVKTQFGYHVIQVEDKRTKPVPTFEEVKPQLEAEEKRALLNEVVEGWRKDAKVETFDINGKPVKAPEVKPAEAAPAPVEPAKAE